MAGRFRVGAALAGVVVLTAGGLVAANWATAETRTKPTGQKSDPVEKVTERSPAVAEALDEHLGSDSGVVGSYYDDAGDLVVAVSDLTAAERARQAGARAPAGPVAGSSPGT